MDERTPTVTAPPTLSWWGHTWRVLLVVVISGLSWSDLATWQIDVSVTWFVLDGVLGVISLVMVLGWRRRYPFAVALFTNVVAALSFSSGGPAALALVSMATRRRWREIVPVFVACLATVPLLVYVNPTGSADRRVDVAAIVVILCLMVAVGMYVGSRRELLATLRSRAEIAEAEQSAKVAQARGAERTRIAREMHDVLAHRISLVTMHAGALAYREDLPPEQVRETARTIQETAHQAMTELRGVLGVLRDGPGDAVPELPQPTACDIVGLVDEWRRAGMRVDLDVTGALDEVPVAVGRTLFRVVQEGLTNAHKHAADTRVAIGLVVEAGTGVRCHLENPLRIGSEASLPGSGLGLVGIRERVELAGGTLQHALTPDRRFALEVWLPWPT